MLADAPRDRRVSLADAVDAGEWRHLIERDPAAHALHAPEVHRLLAGGIPGARARWLELRDSDGILLAGLPLVVRRRFGLWQVVSGANGLYGGPVSNPEHRDAAALLAPAFFSLGGLRTVRREIVWSGTMPPAGDWRGLRPLPTATLRPERDRDFTSWYEESLRTSRRKERRRLQKAGYRVSLEEAGDGLADFHAVYRDRCREWGVRPVPREVLTGLLALGPAWKFFVARDADEGLVGAHICVDLGRELFAWLGTTRRVEGGSVATLLIEEELRWCHASARDALNLGTSAELGGVAEFKRGISAADEPRWILRWQRGRGHR